MTRRFTVTRLILPLKCLISAALIYWLFTRVDAANVMAVLTDTRPGYLFAGLALLLIAQLLSSVRWGLLARSLGFTNKFIEFTAFYWIGMFLNLFLPGTVGGDIGKTVYLVQARPAAASRRTWTGRAAISVVSDRAVGLMVLIWLAALALVMQPALKVPEGVRYTMFVLAAVLLLAGLLLPWLSGILRRGLFRFGQTVADALDTYRRDKGLTVYVVVLAVAIHLFTSAMYLPIAWSVGVNLPRLYVFTLYAIVTLLSAMPITFYGIGLRESALVLMLTPIGVPGEKAFAFGVLLFVVVLVANLSGGAVFLMHRRGTL